jgi:L-ascorbate metabolism protein UlaG (beta-lactamase superfamily)
MNLQDIVLQKRHHGKGCFLNPFTPTIHGRLAEVFKWKLLSKNRFRDLYGDEAVIPVTIDWQPVRDHQGLSVTFINHASVLIKDRENCMLIDPVFNGLSFFIKDFSPLNCNLGSMPKPNHVLLTHGHYDHLDIPTLHSLAKDTQLIMPLGYDGIIDSLAPRPVTRLDWLEDLSTGHGQITLLPCNHWTMRNPLVGPNRSLWGSYLVRTADGPNIYISGDTAWFEGFRELGEMYDIDLAIINVGAYEPRWFMKSGHMNPAEAVRAFSDLGAKHLMVVHWGTFRLGDEPVFLPPIQVKEELAKAGLSDHLIDLNHGQTVYYDQLL